MLPSRAAAGPKAGGGRVSGPRGAVDSRPDPRGGAPPRGSPGGRGRAMGRQWLQKKREIEGAKRGKMATKIVREITVAAKAGTPDPAMNARLALAVEAARKHSVSNETITRAIKRGAGLTGEKIDLELVTYEGFTPHQV